MAGAVRGVKNVLQSELEKAKESLKDVDENIKKLTGRDPTGQRSIQQRRVSLGASEGAPSGGVGRNIAADSSRLFNLARRGIIQDERRTAGGGNLSRRGIVQEEGPVVQRRTKGGAFSRLGPRPGGRDRGPRSRGRDSGDEDELLNRPALQSSVIATNKEERSRQNSIEEQSRDRKGQARNRRMFGLLLGTLQKFKADAADSKDKEEQRIKIEKKLEEKFQQEKEEIIEERRQLFLARRQKQLRIRLLEQKMEMAQSHEEWEVETRKLEKFIRTKAKPHIFYLPKALTEGSEAKVIATKKAVDEMVEQRRKKLENDIAEMMSQVHDDDDDEEGEVDGDDGMDEGRGDHSDGEDLEGEITHGTGTEKPGDDKENTHSERQYDEKDILDTERERRDREREERDRDRQMKEERRRDRHERKESDDRKRREKDRSRSKERDRSGEGRGRDRHDKEKKTRDKHRDHRRDRDRTRSRSAERDRHRSGKNRSDKRSRDYSDDEKSHGHGSKVKRRSKGEGKAEKKEKMWEPMEEEVEEEFVGGKSSEKEASGIENKMLAMAGMSDMAEGKDELNVSEERAIDEVGLTSFAGTGDGLAVEDIPTPSDEMPRARTGGVNITDEKGDDKVEGRDS